MTPTYSTGLAAPAGTTRTVVARVLPFDGNAPGDVRLRTAHGEMLSADTRFMADAPCPGDRVIATCDESGTWLVTARERHDPSPPADTTLADGTTVRRSADRTSVEVVTADGRPMFTYRVGAGGRVVIDGQAIDIHARTDMSLRTNGTLSLEGDAVRLNGRELAVDVTDTRWRGERWDGDLDRATLRARRLETTVETVVQTARDVYQTVRGLAQMQAGRLKTIVEGVAQLRARRVAHRADESYKVRSDKVHLG